MVMLVQANHEKEMVEKGFTLFHDLFTAKEMDDLGCILETFESRKQAELSSGSGVQGITRAGEITFNDHLAERDDSIRTFVSRPEFVQIVTTFLGPDVDLYWNQTVFKYPEGEKVFPWHQDDAYTPVTPAPYLTLWLAINDANEENGCISVLPGSHHMGLRPHEQSPIGLVGYSNEAEEQGVLVPVSAGSVAAFWSLTLHKSGANRSKGMRKAYVIQYCPKGLRKLSDGSLIEGLIPISRDGKPCAHGTH